MGKNGFLKAIAAVLTAGAVFGLIWYIIDEGSLGNLSKEDARRLFMASKLGYDRSNGVPLNEAGEDFFKRLRLFLKGTDEAIVLNICNTSILEEENMLEISRRAHAVKKAVDTAYDILFRMDNPGKEIDEILKAGCARELVVEEAEEVPSAYSLGRIFIFNLLKRRHDQGVHEYEIPDIQVSSRVAQYSIFQDHRSAVYENGRMFRMDVEDVGKMPGGPRRTVQSTDMYTYLCLEVLLLANEFISPRVSIGARGSVSSIQKDEVQQPQHTSRKPVDGEERLFERSKFFKDGSNAQAMEGKTLFSRVNKLRHSFKIGLNDDEEKYTGADVFEILKVFLDQMSRGTANTLCSKEYKSEETRPWLGEYMYKAFRKANRILFKSSDAEDQVNAILAAEEKTEIMRFTSRSDATTALAKAFIRRLLRGTFDMSLDEIKEVPRFNEDFRSDPDLSLHVGRILENIDADKLNSKIKVKCGDGTSFIHFCTLHYLYLSTYLTAQNFKFEFVVGVSDEEADSVFAHSKFSSGEKNDAELTGSEFFRCLKDFLWEIDEVVTSRICSKDVDGVSRRGRLMHKALMDGMWRVFYMYQNASSNWINSFFFRSSEDISSDLSRAFNDEALESGRREKLVSDLLCKAFFRNLFKKRHGIDEYSNDQIFADAIKDEKIAGLETDLAELGRNPWVRVQFADSGPREYRMTQALCQEIYLVSRLIPEAEEDASDATEQTGSGSIVSETSRDFEMTESRDVEERAETPNSLEEFEFPDHRISRRKEAAQEK